MNSSIQYKKLSPRRFGVELEMGEELTKNEVAALIRKVTKRKVISSSFMPTATTDRWHVKPDSSCGTRAHQGPKGVEVASFVGSGEEDLRHIADVAEHLSHHGCHVNHNCGLHVHVDATDLSEINVGRILAYWLKIEGAVASAMPWRRLFSNYCKNTDSNLKPNELKKKWGAQSLYYRLAPKDLRYTNNDDRCFNLNLVNFERASCYKTSERKTLEFRWPEGTLSGLDIKGWVHLFVSFVENCKNKPMPDNLLYCPLEEAMGHLGLGHAPGKFHLFSEGLHYTRLWFLERVRHYHYGKYLKCPASKEYFQYVEEAKNILTFLNSDR